MTDYAILKVLVAMVITCFVFFVRPLLTVRIRQKFSYYFLVVGLTCIGKNVDMNKLNQKNEVEKCIISSSKHDNGVILDFIIFGHADARNVNKNPFISYMSYVYFSLSGLARKMLLLLSLLLMMRMICLFCFVSFV